jgi:hypothetical protein
MSNASIPQRAAHKFAAHFEALAQRAGGFEAALVGQLDDGIAVEPDVAQCPGNSLVECRVSGGVESAGGCMRVMKMVDNGLLSEIQGNEALRG